MPFGQPCDMHTLGRQLFQTSFNITSTAPTSTSTLYSYLTWSRGLWAFSCGPVSDTENSLFSLSVWNRMNASCGALGGNGIPGTCSAGCIKGQLDPLSGVCVTVIIFGLFFHLLASQRGSRMGFKGNRAVESGWRIYFERGGRIEAESCICITAFPYHSYDAPSLLLVESLATMQTCRIYVPQAKTLVEVSGIEDQRKIRAFESPFRMMSGVLL